MKRARAKKPRAAFDTPADFVPADFDGATMQNELASLLGRTEQRIGVVETQVRDANTELSILYTGKDAMDKVLGRNVPTVPATTTSRR